jgi:hypothetical protein
MADGSLPDQIVESIAISNAKSIGEQPAILSNLALANQILNNNMQQQLMLSQQQAMNQITMATLAKCVSLITRSDGSDPEESSAVSTAVKAMNKMYETWSKVVEKTTVLKPQPSEETEHPGEP